MSIPPNSTAGLDVGALGRQGAAAMLFRTIAMRGITAVGTVILARVLVPADFGVFAVLAVAQQLLAFLADFGVAPSLIQQEHDPTHDELATAWTIQLIMWILCAAAIWLGVLAVERLVPDLGPSFAWQLRLLSASIACTMLRSLPTSILVRVLRFREVAAIELAAHLGFWVSAVTLALLGAGSWCFSLGLFIQTLTGCVAANLICRFWPGIHFDRQIARRLLGFGIAYQVSNVVTTLRDGVVPVFGGIAGGVAAIGYLQFGLRISQLTASLDEIIARVAFPAFSRMKSDAQRTKRVLGDIVTFVALPVGASQAWLIATAPILVPVVFGERWSPSAPVLQLMCVGVLAAVPSRVAGSVVFGQGRPRAGLVVTLTTVGLLYVLFPSSLLAFGIVGGGLAYAVANAAGLAMQARAVAPVTPFPWAGLTRAYSIAAVAGLPSWFIASSVGGAAGLALSTGIYALVYVLLLLAFGRDQLARSWQLAGLADLPALASLTTRLRAGWTTGSELDEPAGTIQPEVAEGDILPG